MKNNKLRARLQKDRPMTMISLRIPDDVLEDLKLVAPRLGFTGYQPLIRAYIGQGLRADLARLEEDTELMQLIESLRKHGVNDEVIASAMADVEELKKAA
jgi:antitoxin component of RelBE/YafQ-DinJ toxin-antitoxin module